jgi:hypothetical protein
MEGVTMASLFQCDVVVVVVVVVVVTSSALRIRVENCGEPKGPKKSIILLFEQSSNQSFRNGLLVLWRGNCSKTRQVFIMTDDPWTSHYGYCIDLLSMLNAQIFIEWLVLTVSTAFFSVY